MNRPDATTAREGSLAGELLGQKTSFPRSIRSGPMQPLIPSNLPRVTSGALQLTESRQSDDHESGMFPTHTFLILL